VSASSNLARRAVLVLSLLALAVAARSFTFTRNESTGLPIKWPAGGVRLKLMLGDTANLSDGSSFNQSARTAALVWNNVLGSVQFQTENATGSPATDNDVNELGFAATVFGRSFDSNTLAVTTGFSSGNERVEADITFNTAFTWDSYRGNRRAGPNSPVDVQRVALHELGHVLGLDHPDEDGQAVDAIMNSIIGNRFELSTDDIEGGQSLYGPPGVAANDQFANAAVLSLGGSQSVTVKGYNTNATKEAGEPSHANNGGPDPAPNAGGRSVWWRWATPSAGSVTIDTKGSYFDTILGVYTGSSLTGLNRVASSDDVNPGIVQASTVTFTTTAGTEYRIAVDGFNNDDGFGADSGGLTLNLAFNGTLGTAPAITTQPASQSVNTGASVSFSVAASGTAPLSYQWHFNNSPISGATNSSFSITSAAAANAGSYHVVVSNQAGSVTSNAATLTVNTPPPAPPPPSGGGGGGGGGGGAPSLWFVGALALLGLGLLFARK
jgi:hypothetical protein